MDSIEAQFAAEAEILVVLGVLNGLFLFAVVAEFLWDRTAGRRQRLAETFANFAIAAVGALLERSAYGLVFILGLALAAPFALFDIPVNAASWAAAVVVADFSYYWMHRCEHQVRLLWAYHSVHHSSPEFNLSTSLRLAWTEGLVEWIFFVPMVLLGFGVAQTVVALLVVVIYQTWLHTEKIGRLWPLEGVLNTPSAHRVHHGMNGSYRDKNYGGILLLWDRLFGTYRREREPLIYGVTDPVGSSNPLRIQFNEYARIVKDMRHAASSAEAFSYLLRRPGWSPAVPQTLSERGRDRARRQYQNSASSHRSC